MNGLPPVPSASAADRFNSCARTRCWSRCPPPRFTDRQDEVSAPNAPASKRPPTGQRGGVIVVGVPR